MTWVISDFEVIKLFSCLAQLRLKFILLINCWHFNIYEHDKLLVF